jgi:hypothetical protein
MANTSIDRRCLRSYYEYLSQDDAVQSLVCFSCACSHPYVPALRSRGIRYLQAFPDKQRKDFLGLSTVQTKVFFFFFYTLS